MSTANDIQLDIPETRGPNEQIQMPSTSLTLPPIELMEPALGKKLKRRKPLRKRRKKTVRKNIEPDPINLYSQKSQSLEESSDDQLQLSSLDSRISHASNDRISTVTSLFKSFITLHAIAYAVLLPSMWYNQHCSSEEGSLTCFDNMLAYTICIVSVGCVVFSQEVQNTYPYNFIYSSMATGALGYLVAKIVCNRELILMMEMAAIVGIEGVTIYLIAIFSSKDFTPLTPVLTAAYVCTTVLNIFIIYFVADSVPVVMLSIINLFLTYGLCVCIAQFPITRDSRYRLPPERKVFGAILLHFGVNSLSYHTYLTIAAIFDVYGSKKFEYYVVNLTFYLEQ